MANESTQKRRDAAPRNDRPVEADTRVTEPDGSPAPGRDAEAPRRDAASEPRHTERKR